MAHSKWRNQARPIIAKVLAETAGRSEAEIKAALFDAYPFGPREHHPYKIWLDEIRVQRGLKPEKKKAYDGSTRELFDARAKGLV